jgi:DNA replication and repair protein RecF
VRALALSTLQVRSFRNLAAIDLELGPRFNVVSGDNGQGKTNLLEAIYVLATSRSFRASRPGELVMHDAELASVRGVFDEEGERREQSVGLKHGARVVRVDGKRPGTLADYAVRTPCVVFHPGVLALSMGGGSERRKLLDRVALYLSPVSLDDGESYARALRERQRALETRGVDARDLEDWEDLCVRHGLALSDCRARACALLAEHAIAAFARIAAPDLVLRVAYARSAPESAEEYRRALVTSRGRDVRRGSASIGPHRDDIALEIDGHAARGVASQGQHRALVLALKLAEIAAVGGARGVQPMLLLDDVSSELDRDRTAALFAFLRSSSGQVFLTTTRAELIDTGGGHERLDFTVVRGGIQRALT